MKQSQLFTKTIKEIPKDETSFNAQTLIRAGFVDKVSAGVYSFLPLGWRVLRKITEIVRDEMEKLGGQEINMSALAPKSLWNTTGRWDSFDGLFKLGAADSKEYALCPTHEEMISPLMKKFVLSYKDLPFSAFQIQTKFRNEKRAKAGLMRGREFLMKDLYSFHQNQEDLDIFYEKSQASYYNIYNRLGLGDKTYLTYASGGSFAKYSHEYQTLSSSGEDLIYICEKCKVAINKEIIDDLDSCPVCDNKELREEKAIEVGNIFKLGTRFSEPFSLIYKDDKGKDNLVYMGCYGVGISRLLGTIVEECHDEKGIIWPETVAPYRVHIISISENEKAEELYENLTSEGIEVLLDDRDVSVGEKFADSDLIGCPYRIVVSRKTLEKGGYELKRRNSEEVELVESDKIIEIIK